MFNFTIYRSGYFSVTGNNLKGINDIIQDFIEMNRNANRALFSYYRSP